MARRFGDRVTGVLLACLLGCGPPPPNRELRVLFVGNSRIYFHDQPAMVEALATANGRSLSWKMHVEGGASLRDNIRSGALDEVRSEPWDAVVINEQSTWGLTTYVEGIERVPRAPESYFASVDSFARAARDTGARLLLVQHPKHRDMPVADGDRLIQGFAEAARRNTGTTVVPLERAWRVASTSLPDVDLYESDDNHPSEIGALLQAISMYDALFGASPRSVPSVIRGAFVEQDDGILHPDSIVDLVRAGSALSAALIEVAEEAASEPSNVGDTVRPLHEDLPRLPERSPAVEGETLRGSWRGTMQLYPRYLPWPADMTVSIGGDSTGLTTSLRLSFGDAIPDIFYPVLPVSDEGPYLQFLDPDGPNGGFVRYRLVPVGDSLRGIAEFTNEETVYGIGSVALGPS